VIFDLKSKPGRVSDINNQPSQITHLLFSVLSVAGNPYEVHPAGLGDAEE
jgi:hypothetical protein